MSFHDYLNESKSKDAFKNPKLWRPFNDLELDKEMSKRKIMKHDKYSWPGAGTMINKDDGSYVSLSDYNKLLVEYIHVLNKLERAGEKVKQEILSK